MMKRIIRPAWALCAVTLALTACGNPFTRITIKGGPSLYAPLGSTRFVLSDYFTAANLAEIIAGASQGQSFEYRDSLDPTTLNMMIRYPLADVSVDFNQYMESIDFASSVEQAIPLQEFTVPEISLHQQETINLSLLSHILDQINGSYSPIPVSVPESSAPLSPGYPLIDQIELSSSAFTSVTFSGGSFDFVFTMNDASPPAQLSLTSIGLYDGSGNPLSTSGPVSIDLTQPSAFVSLPLSGVTLPQDSYLRFAFSTSGGVDGQFCDIEVSPSLSAGTTISGGSGVNFSWDVTVPDIVIPLDLDSSFQGAVISSGSLDFTVPSLGPDYTNFFTSLDLQVSQPTGLSVGTIGSTAVVTSLSLAGQTLTGEDITATAVYHVNAVNASFINYPSGGLEITCTAEAAVAGFTSLTILPGSDFNPNQSHLVSEALDPQLAEWIQSIHFSEVGLSVSLSNGLPAGNDISLGVQSTIFSINSSGSYPGASTTDRDFLSYDYTLDPSSHANVDFTLTTTLSGYDSGTGLLTLSGLTAGATYSLEGTVTVVADWDCLTLRSATAITGSYPESGGLDLSTLGTYLGDGINFGAMPAYLYLSGVNDLSANMRLQATYTANETPTSIYLLGTAGTPETVPAVNPLVLPLDANGAYQGAIPPASATIGNLADVFNARPADLALSYEVTLGSTVITPADIATGATLAAELLIVLPLKLVVTNPEGAPLVLDSLLGDFLSKDLFQRTEGGDNSTIDMLLDSLSSMSLTLDIVNDTGLSLNAALSHGTAINIPIDLSLAKQTVTLDQDDIRFIKDTIPFSPNISVKLPPGEWKLRNDAGITVGLAVTAVTDFEQTSELGGGK